MTHPEIPARGRASFLPRGDRATRSGPSARDARLLVALGVSLGVSLGASLLAAGAATAAPLDLPGGCVSARASLHGTDGKLEADRLEITLPAEPNAAFHAIHLSAVARGAPLPPGALGRASTAAAAALLGALTGHHGAGCSNQVFEDAMAPLARAIAAGGHAGFTWNGVSLRSGARRMGAARVSLQLDGAGDTARLTLQVAGSASNDQAAPLLPERLELEASLPANQLPALAAASGGHGAPVDLSIDRLRAVRGDTVLTGHGTARIAADPADNSGTAHVTVSGFDSLLDAAGTAGLEKLRTGLFLAKLMAHRTGGDAEWDLNWQGGTLLVNNVPLPMR